MRVGISLPFFSQTRSISALSSPSLAPIVILRSPRLSRANDIDSGGAETLTHYDVIKTLSQLTRAVR